MRRIILTTTAVVLGLSLAHAANDEPWLEEGWEPITEEERQPATEQEVEQVSLTEREANDIRYLTGGIGVAEREWLDRHGANYTQRLEFSRGERGAFVSRVALTVRDRDGSVVFEAESDGPIMYVDLPEGRYRAEASYAGETREFSLNVRAGGQSRTHVNFP
ncbi:hypothetical protein [Guyparkeria sp.]|uniref:hypothetical protein n=1 Tax=Guyparkeria sp. TaxID=2035736 RepID=UPI003970A1CD